MTLSTDPSLAPERRRVLVVEDDPPILDLLRQVLEDEGLSVQVATTGRAALAAVASVRPDLILLDLGLPELDGVRLAGQLAGDVVAHAATPPIIVVSADPAIEARAATIGAVAFLAKPFDLDELVALVFSVLEPGR